MFYIGVNMAKKEKANGMAILNEQINKKEFSRVYLLGGTEPYLIYQYRDKLIAAMIDPNDTMNFITYKGENSKPEDIIEFADTMPFLQNAEWCWLRTAISSRTAVKSWKKP